MAHKGGLKVKKKLLKDQVKVLAFSCGGPRISFFGKFMCYKRGLQACSRYS